MQLVKRSRCDHSDAMKLKGTGRILFWPGGSLWMGLARGGSELHAHHAIQIAFGIEAPIRLRKSSDEQWTDYSGAIIGADVPHEYMATGRLVANLFLEPESTMGRRLIERFGLTCVTALDAEIAGTLIQPLSFLFWDDASDADLIEETLRIFRALSGLGAPQTPTDPRVVRVIDWVHAHIDEPLTLGAAAGLAHLSESRFRHLFVAETGIAFRPYVLWARVKRAIEIGFDGVSWTDAAMGANFADQAHLTRTCRRMFGLSPSALTPRPAGLLPFSAE